MKFDASLLVHDLKQMPELARFADQTGFDGIWTFETAHEPFLPLVLAAEHSQRLTVGTSIAVAFARSPAILASIAWDLARFSRGRFILGLGTQVKGHNERRFGVKWDKPVEKMREVILAVRAFWECWQNGTRLNFQGEYFKLNLMTPFFSPAPHEYYGIPIFIAGVNRRMCQLGGELCDGFHVHPLHTRRYLTEVVLPNIEEGLVKGGRQRSQAYQERITDEAERSKRYKRNLSLLMVDIDDFKKVNDTLGHDCGDIVLQNVASQLTQSIRQVDFVARIGGEEFVIVLPETDLCGAIDLANRLRTAVKARVIETPQAKLSVTVSIGVGSGVLSDSADHRQMIFDADQALYVAKRSGKDRVETASRQDIEAAAGI